MTQAPDSAIGRYQILGFMARGETTIIYEALDPESGRQIALKILPPSVARDPEQADDFLRLAERLARLDQANLLKIIDYGREDGVPYMTMPVAQGGTLDDHLDEFSDTDIALTLVATLAQAVDYLHDNDIIHGRIEPGHVLLDEQGQPLLTGFGRPHVQGESRLAPAFQAPEQFQGQAPEARSDIYQLGALLHLLLLGGLPGPDDESPAGAHEESLGPDVQAILNRSLAADPEERFQTAAELAGQLTTAAERPDAPEEDSEDAAEAASEEVDSAVQPESSSYALPLPFQNKNPIWLAAAVAGLVIILALCCLLTVFAVSSVNGRLRQPRATAQIDTNVRAGPDIKYQIVGILRQGQQATIHGVSPDGRWWQIAFEGAPGGKGWVPAAFVKVDRFGKVDVVPPPSAAPEVSLPLPASDKLSSGYQV